MTHRLRSAALIAAFAGAATSYAAPLKELAPAQKDAVPAAKEKAVSDNRGSVSQRFRTLDDYLLFLERGAAVGKGWYRQIRPGVYRLETGNLRGPYSGQRLFTREELERRFGFRR